MKPPSLVVADENGNVIDVPGLSMAVSSLRGPVMPDEESLVPLPPSSLLFALPSRMAIGVDPIGEKFVEVPQFAGKRVFAAAAFMPPGYICTAHAAYRETRGAPRLPLYCYAAVGWRSGKFYAAGSRVDRQLRHDIPDKELSLVDEKARKFLGRFSRNRLVDHLVNNCVLKYRCPNACNLVLGRWECPIPVSINCNASCVGCISRQPAGSCIPSTQNRLNFTPTAEEIIEYVVPHLKHAPNPIASFGQGCEGEPLLAVGLLEDAIRGIRAVTKRGVININTNASLPAAVERLCKAGLNSMRVSLNSAQPQLYNAYYRPKGYLLDDVQESMMIAKRHSVWISINYLVFPGLTDHPKEIAALGKLIRKTGIDMIQTRNLNIDPAWYIDALGLNELQGESKGMIHWLHEMKRMFPHVKIGYYNPTLRTMRS
jgi:molybdenum cofactor biosynthesis enzyme MoaA